MKLYRKMMDLSKRLIALHLVFSILFVTLVYDLIAPLNVYADTLEDNQAGNYLASIADGDTMQNNWGTVGENHGTIVNNIGSAGYDEDGNPTGSGGQVTNNYGSINDGHVTDNYGNVIGNSTVLNNYANGAAGAGVNVGINYGGNTVEGTIVESVQDYYLGPNPVPPGYVPPSSESSSSPSAGEGDSSSEDAAVPVRNPLDDLNTSITQGLATNLAGNVSIDMGTTNNFTPNMIQTLVNANTSVGVELSMKVNGRESRLVIPKNANMKLISIFLETMDFSAEGYSFLLNLIPGSSLTYEDDNGDEITITNTMSEDQVNSFLENGIKLHESMTETEFDAFCAASFGPGYKDYLLNAKPKNNVVVTKDGEVGLLVSKKSFHIDDDDDDLSFSSSSNSGTSSASFVTYTTPENEFALIPLTGEGAGASASSGSGRGRLPVGNRAADRSGVLGVKTETGDSTKKTTDDSTKKTDASTNGEDSNSNQKLVKVENSLVPLADSPFDERFGSGMNWMWLAGIGAAAGAGALSFTGLRKKKSVNDEIKKYKK